MPTDNKDLMEAAKKAIEDVFADTSTDSEETKENLGELIEECEIRISSIEDDDLDDQ